MLIPSVTIAQTYWFEEYERALELIQDGRMEDASRLLDEVIEKHPVPDAKMRVPGNSFLDYLPYFQRARVEFDQERYEVAARNLDISEAFGAITKNRRAMEALAEMRESLRSLNLGANRPSTDSAAADATSGVPR